MHSTSITHIFRLVLLRIAEMDSRMKLCHNQNVAIPFFQCYIHFKSQMGNSLIQMTTFLQLLRIVSRNTLTNTCRYVRFHLRPIIALGYFPNAFLCAWMQEVMVPFNDLLSVVFRSYFLRYLCVF